jgi:hypothetical protein
MNVKDYLKYSSIIALFLEVVQFHYIIDLRLSYIILIFNSLIISAYQINFNKNNILILISLTIHGLLGVIVYRYPFTSLISQLVGISISSIYFYNLIKFIDYKELFEKYAVISYYICVLGLIMFYLGITVWDTERLHSILNEPSRFVILVLPSVYYFLKEKRYFKFSIVLISLILAQSSIGYIGLLLFIILPNLKIKFLKKFIYFLPLLFVFVWFLSKNENFQRRYNQTLESIDVFKTREFSQKYINISSYSLLSNAYVSLQNFKKQPLGTGLGSYKARYDIYIKELTIPKYLITLNQSDINSPDANSLFLRMVADLGIFGIFVIIYFMIKFIKSYNFFSLEGIIAQSLVVYFLLKLLRQGHYFPQEFYFFLWMFIFAYKEAKTLNKTTTLK